MCGLQTSTITTLTGSYQGGVLLLQRFSWLVSVSKDAANFAQAQLPSTCIDRVKGWYTGPVRPVAVSLLIGNINEDSWGGSGKTRVNMTARTLKEECKRQHFLPYLCQKGLAPCSVRCLNVGVVLVLPQWYRFGPEVDAAISLLKLKKCNDENLPRLSQLSIPMSDGRHNMQRLAESQFCRCKVKFGIPA